MLDQENAVVHVRLRDRGYDIEIGPGRLPTAGARASDWASGGSPAGRFAGVVCDENTANYASTVETSLAEAGYRTGRLTFPAGEQTKSVNNVARGYDWLAGERADRGAVVVAVGGGVIGDLAGFLAASYLRGVAFVQIPTTLLADVDSSVGGKTGVNITAGKNLVGAFHQPAGVLIDTDTLDTLSDRELSAGLAEVVKYGVILDAEFFEWLEGNREAVLSRDRAALTHIIARSCRLKADVVEADERETTGERAKLNYGHTFGHAYESLLGYGTMLHGEAVSVGMLHASELAVRLGLIDPPATDRQRSLLESFHLPTRLVAPVDVDAVIQKMASDKKADAGRLRFILPTRIGEVRLFDDVPVDSLHASLETSLSA